MRKYLFYKKEFLKQIDYSKTSIFKVIQLILFGFSSIKQRDSKILLTSRYSNHPDIHIKSNRSNLEYWFIALQYYKKPFQFPEIPNEKNKYPILHSELSKKSITYILEMPALGQKNNRIQTLNLNLIQDFLQYFHTSEIEPQIEYLPGFFDLSKRVSHKFQNESAVIKYKTFKSWTVYLTYFHFEKLNNK